MLLSDKSVSARDCQGSEYSWLDSPSTSIATNNKMACTNILTVVQAGGKYPPCLVTTLKNCWSHITPKSDQGSLGRVLCLQHHSQPLTRYRQCLECNVHRKETAFTSTSAATHVYMLHWQGHCWLQKDDTKCKFKIDWIVSLMKGGARMPLVAGKAQQPHGALKERTAPRYCLLIVISLLWAS